MNARLVAYVLALAGLVVGAATTASASGAHQVTYKSLEQGLWGVWSKPALVAAANECEWTTQMDQLASDGGLTVLPPPRLQGVDWSRQTAVLVALGTMDGYSVEVTGAWRSGSTLTLDVHVTMGQGSGELDRSPYHLLAVDASGLSEVTALYDLGLPGLPASVALAGCGVAPLAQNGRGPARGQLQSAPGSSGPVGWGELKVRYR